VFLEGPGVTELVDCTVGEAGIRRSAGPAIFGTGAVPPDVVVAGWDPLHLEPPERHLSGVDVRAGCVLVAVIGFR